MEGVARQRQTTYKVAVVGSEPLQLGFKLAGVTRSFIVGTRDEAESKLRELMNEPDVGIIVFTSKAAKLITDRKLRLAMQTSVLPLFVEVPDYDEKTASESMLRELILKAVGIDVREGMWK
jgi:V/A-type H+-transporting ATPase subunit F